MFGYNENEVLGFNIKNILTPAENAEDMEIIIEKLVPLIIWYLFLIKFSKNY